MSVLPAHVAQRLAGALAPRVRGGAAESNREALEPAALRLQKGSVTAVDAGPPRTATVQTDGTNDRVKADALYWPTVGENVYVLEQPPYLVVVGPVAAPAFHAVGAVGEPGFTHGWGNFGGGFNPARFWIDGLGVVHLEGTLQGGTVPDSAFTLPVAFRPAETVPFPADVGGTFSRVDVTAAGLVVVGLTNSPPATPYAVLNGMTFRAAA